MSALPRYVAAQVDGKRVVLRRDKDGTYLADRVADSRRSALSLADDLNKAADGANATAAAIEWKLANYERLVRHPIFIQCWHDGDYIDALLARLTAAEAAVKHRIAVEDSLIDLDPTALARAEHADPFAA